MTVPELPTVALVLSRRPEIFRVEPFYHDLVLGLERVLERRAVTLVTQISADPDDEVASYRRWAADGRVDLVVLARVHENDPRIDLVRSLGLKSVVLAPCQGVRPTLNWPDQGEAARLLMKVAAELGHRRVAHVSGPSDLVHTGVRSQVLEADAAARGMHLITVVGDHTEESGSVLTRELLTDSAAPTMVIYGNDLMALGGLSAARDLGRRVPEDVALVAWDDSALCQSATPPLTALHNDVRLLGEGLGELVLAVLDDHDWTGLAKDAPPPRVIWRGTT